MLSYKRQKSLWESLIFSVGKSNFGPGDCFPYCVLSLAYFVAYILFYFSVLICGHFARLFQLSASFAGLFVAYAGRSIHNWSCFR